MTVSLIPTERFSFNSHRMLSLRDTVLRLWEEQVRQALPRTGKLSHPVLIDTMPLLYERMCAILTPAYFGRDGIDVSAIAAEHGIKRANLTVYDVETVLAEFQVFRGVLFDTLDAHEVVLTGPERRAMHLTIDVVVRESVRAFVMVADSLRDLVLRAWEDQLRETLPRAGKLSQPVLIDTMPVLYERMCAILTPAYFGRDGIDVSAIAAEHGIERANLTVYDVDTVLAEFHLFRSVLFDTLDAHEVVLTGPERRALHLTIDTVVRESVRAFVMVADSVRERFAGALAHDLRQPVSNVTMGAQLILRLQPPPAIADWAGRIVKNGERMSAMLKELLDALALQSGDRLKLALSEFELLALAESVAQRARDYQGADVRVDGEPITGWWSQPALERALENLVNNAHKYGDPGTPIEIHLAVNNERIVLSVRNQGKPIPASEFEAIFQQFVRAKDAGDTPSGSWGLGLPYVRTVAQSHGGSAVVFSDAEAGTVFVIDVPVDARPYQGSGGLLC